MCNLHNQYDKFFVGDRINNTIITLADAIFVMPRQLLADRRSWIFRKTFDSLENADAIIFWKGFYFLGGRLLDGKSIACHVSVDP